MIHAHENMIKGRNKDCVRFVTMIKLLLRSLHATRMRYFGMIAAKNAANRVMQFYDNGVVKLKAVKYVSIVVVLC